MDKGLVSLLLATTLLLAALAGVAWYKTQLNTKPEPTYQATLDEDCDLNKLACTSLINLTSDKSTSPIKKSVYFSIVPRPIPLVSDLNLSVKSDLNDIQQVKIEFVGVDMEMGPNHVVLTQQSQGVYKGKGMLPVCIRNRMTWKALVYIKTSDGLYLIPHQFVTNKT